MTTALLSDNPEYYTVWNYRRLILQDVFRKELSSTTPDATSESAPGLTPAQTEISLLLKEDLQFLTSLQRFHPKCYWMWNHRSWLLDQALTHLPTEAAKAFWAGELALVTKMLTRDDRNFHGWSYRRTVTSALEELSFRSLRAEADTADKPESALRALASFAVPEFEYSDRVVRANFSNFSAWHHRLQAVRRRLDEQNADETTRRAAYEAELALAAELLWAATDPKDQSLWFYHGDLMAMLDPGTPQVSRLFRELDDEQRREYIEGQVQAVKEILEDNEDCKWIYQSLLSMAQLYDKVGGNADRDEMRTWLDSLEKLDPLRRGRWKDLRQKLRL